MTENLAGVSIITESRQSFGGLEYGLRKMRRKINGVWEPLGYIGYGEKYGGHYSVTRSLVEGLKLNHTPFNLNPPLEQLYQRVHVLSDHRLLPEFVALKKTGQIAALSAGPGLAVRIRDYPDRVLFPEVDKYLVPSRWNKAFWANDCSDMSFRCKIWPAGVNHQFWDPGNDPKRTKCLVFDKNNSSFLAKDIDIHSILKELHIPYSKLERIDKDKIFYSVSHYKQLLAEAKVMIGFSLPSESQGLAWAEAWSMDVPTLIYSTSSDPLDPNPAPLMNPAVGSFFSSASELRKLLRMHWEGRDAYSPRQWIIDNLTDKISAKNFLRSIDVAS